MSNATTLARIQLARRNEDRVLAEASRQGQVFFTWMRVFLVGALGISQELVARKFLGRPGFDPLLPIVGVAYLAGNAGIALYLRRLRNPRPSQAIAGQCWRAVFDYAFLVFQGWRLSRLDGAQPSNGILIFAIYLVFASASYNVWVVAWNVVLAIGALLTAEWLDNFHLPVDVTAFTCAGYLVLGLCVAGIGRFIQRMFVDLRRRDNLTRFLAPQVAEHVMTLGDLALAPTQREVTVLFSDIRDFTSLSEKLPPEEVLSMLDEYFSHMGQIVKGRDGIVNKFIGDGLLAFWNVPDRDADHALHAIQAALDMRTKLRELNAHRAVLGKVPLRIGVGVHTGTVAAGMLGGADQHEYTVIGDAVNVASRVEGLTKPLGCEILVTESTWALLNGRFAGRRVAEEKVKGREQPVVVYALDLEADALAAG